MTIDRKFGRRGEINDYWNGSACDQREMIWPYRVIGTVLVAIVVMVIWSVWPLLES